FGTAKGVAGCHWSHQTAFAVLHAGRNLREKDVAFFEKRESGLTVFRRYAVGKVELAALGQQLHWNNRTKFVRCRRSTRIAGRECCHVANAASSPFLWR